MTLRAVCCSEQSDDGQVSRADLGCPDGLVLHDGGQPRRILRLAYVGRGATFEPHRAGGTHVLAADAALGQRLNPQEAGARPNTPEVLTARYTCQTLGSQALAAPENSV